MATDKSRRSIPPAIRELFFALLRAGLHPDRAAGPVTLPASNPWPALCRLAAAQGVSAIVRDGLETLHAQGLLADEAMPPRTIRLQWALNVERIEQLYARQRRVIGRLAAFMHGHGIPMMLLKGYGLSLSYPRPEHRPCGDIDVWFYGRQQEADELLRRERQVQIDEDVHHHTTFTLDGILIENHFDFLNIHAHLSNRPIEEQLQRCAREEPSEQVEVDGAPVQLPPANFNALFLLRHAAMHFAAMEIGMRHVADWAMFIEHSHNGIDWEALYVLARRMNMHRFLNCLNAIAIDRLGVDAGMIPAFDRDPALEERVLADILQPEFSETPPAGGLLRTVWFRTRRWWCNRWKHRIVYNEGLLWTFLVQVRSHLMKPRSLTH